MDVEPRTENIDSSFCFQWPATLMEYRQGGVRYDADAEQ